MKKLLFTFALLGMTSACSDSKPNVEIEVYDRAGLYMKSIEVKVKAIEDDVVISPFLTEVKSRDLGH